MYIIDVKNQSFYAEFYLNMSWAGKHSAKNFEFVNSNYFIKMFYSEWTIKKWI